MRFLGTEGLAEAPDSAEAWGLGCWAAAAPASPLAGALAGWDAAPAKPAPGTEALAAGAWDAPGLAAGTVAEAAAGASAAATPKEEPAGPPASAGEAGAATAGSLDTFTLCPATEGRLLVGFLAIRLRAGRFG